jgi:pyrroline-5-carboxylate reductase
VAPGDESIRSRKIGFPGFGRIGEAIALGLFERAGVRRENVFASVRQPESIDRAARRAVRASTDNRAVVDSSEILILATKPQAVATLLDEIRGRPCAPSNSS